MHGWGTRRQKINRAISSAAMQHQMIFFNVFVDLCTVIVLIEFFGLESHLEAFFSE